jgi:hypothetical protein
MENEIRMHLHDPRLLEKMYRANKLLFKRAFSTLYPEIKGNTLADYWNERLNYEADEINWGTRGELLFVIMAAVVAGVIAKLPAIFSIDENFFYPRNIGFIIFPALTAYFAWKHKLSAGKIAFISLATLAGLIFINFLPDIEKSDTSLLSCIHLVLFLWSLLGFAFVDGQWKNDGKRLDYLQYNGDLLVMTTLIVIAAGILTGITIGLFTLIGYDIREFYFEHIVLFGLPAAPILATYLIRTNPQLVGKVSPVIARIFSPLVLVMLVIYLGAMGFSGKDPYNDREFLMVFNALLIGVMAIIFFSVADTVKTTRTQVEIWVLFLLSVLTIIVNGIALSAILFRISEWGFTPNRAAVLGGNVLILINLVLVTVQLYRVVSKKGEVASVGRSIAAYLPVYCAWVTIVTFLFPLLFGFR